MHHVSNRNIRTSLFIKHRRDRHRALLFVGADQSVLDRLRFGIERDLPLITIEECSRPTAIAPSYRDTLALVVIAPSDVFELEARAFELLRFHPLAKIAVMTDGAPLDPAMLQHLRSWNLVRGVLPTQMKVDLLTPILALMLRGGDYYPWTVAQTDILPKIKAPTLQPILGLAEPQVDHLSSLTRREHQILTMVARGLQNKSIACDLSLSEHTVKIHLHNIITKLGTRNRTEAAAVFRDSGWSNAACTQLFMAGTNAS
jgi:DNA-binding NarL/FixJ family response regulator